MRGLRGHGVRWRTVGYVVLYLTCTSILVGFLTGVGWVLAQLMLSASEYLSEMANPG